MELKNILHISGKKGLYKILSQSKSFIVVESLNEKKKMPIYGNSNANSLDDITIYTYEGTIPLSKVLIRIYQKEKGGECISHKSTSQEMSVYFREVLKEYNEDRVYISDIKKILQWYNILCKTEILKKVASNQEK